MLCPFLDSRMLRLALNLPADVRFRYRRPKDLLKRALTRHAPAELATRAKLGFGQPVFEWLAPGGQLRPSVDRLGDHPFVDRATLDRVRAEGEKIAAGGMGPPQNRENNPMQSRAERLT